ncbi:MAG: EutN/CcmL family microcompartment protein [Thermogutta sp.]
MRVGKVIGTVTLNRAHPSLRGARFKIVVPLSLEMLLNTRPADTEELVVYDELGAHDGCLVAFSEGREAAQPFSEPKPVDAYLAAILDHVEATPLEEIMSDSLK